MSFEKRTLRWVRAHNATWRGEGTNSEKEKERPTGKHGSEKCVATIRHRITKKMDCQRKNPMSYENNQGKGDQQKGHTHFDGKERRKEEEEEQNRGTQALLLPRRVRRKTKFVWNRGSELMSNGRKSAMQNPLKREKRNPSGGGKGGGKIGGKESDRIFQRGGNGNILPIVTGTDWAFESTFG